MQDDILKDNYIKYAKLPEENGAQPPKVSDEVNVYGCKYASIELSRHAVSDLLSRTKNMTISNFSKDLSKKEIVKYVMTFFTRFFCDDLDLMIRKENILGRIAGKRTIRGVSKKHLRKIPVKYNVKEKLGNSGAVQSKKSSKASGYVAKEIRMGGKPSYSTIPVLAHEYAHILAFKSQHSIENHINIEVIPMLIENLILYDAIQNEKNPKIISLLNQTAKQRHIDRFNNMVTSIKATVAFLDNRKKNVEKEIEQCIEGCPTPCQKSILLSILESYRNGEDVYGKHPDVDVILAGNETYRKNLTLQQDIAFDKNRVLNTDVDSAYVHGIGALYAYGLFDKFVSMNPNEQITFKKFLCNCLNGNNSIEQMLDKYGIVIDKKLVNRYTNQVSKYSSELSIEDSPR